MTRPARPGRVLTALTAVALTVSACASGPSQAERVTLARDAYTTVTTFSRDAEERLMALYPDLSLPSSGSGAGTGNWTACTDESYSDHYDSPEGSTWLDSSVYVLEPRQPTGHLVEPFAQTYLDDGWTLTRDDLDQDPPDVALAKDGYRLVISGVTQRHLDRRTEQDAYFTLVIYSPCLPSPANLTEWDPDHPDDFDLPGRNG